MGAPPKSSGCGGWRATREANTPGAPGILTSSEASAKAWPWQGDSSGLGGKWLFRSSDLRLRRRIWVGETMVGRLLFLLVRLAVRVSRRDIWRHSRTSLETYTPRSRNLPPFGSVGPSTVSCANHGLLYKEQTFNVQLYINCCWMFFCWNCCWN